MAEAVRAGYSCLRPTRGSPVNPDRARELLTTELRELDDRAEFAAASVADTATGNETADEGSLTQHPGDLGTDVANRMESEGLAHTVQLQRRRVRDALDRLDQGSYGRCAVCGREIDDERLEARPEVATCREHADAQPVGG
jgi:RNA polymerase-binding transcription factor DksA